MPHRYPPQVDPDRPQDSHDEAVYKIHFLNAAFSQPLHANERFSLDDAAMIGLGYVLRDIEFQLRDSVDALLVKLKQKEVKQ